MHSELTAKESPSFSTRQVLDWLPVEEGELKAIKQIGAQFKKRKLNIIEVLEAAEKKLHQKTVTVTSEAFEATGQVRRAS